MKLTDLREETHDKVELLMELFRLTQSKTLKVVEDIPEADRAKVVEQAISFLNNAHGLPLLSNLDIIATTLINLKSRADSAKEQMDNAKVVAVYAPVATLLGVIDTIDQAQQLHDDLTNVKQIASRLDIYRDWVTDQEPPDHIKAVKPFIVAALKELGIKGI